MKVVLTHAYFLNDDPKEKVIMKPYAPLGILGIAAYLEQHEVPCQIFDSTFSDRLSWINFLAEEKPDVVGLYANLMTRPVLLQLVQDLRKNPATKKIKVVVGGPDTRYNAELYLQHGIDLLVVGEGETTFLEIVEHYKHSGQLPLHLEGTAYLLNQKAVFNSERSLLKSLAELPQPARHKIDLKLYLDVWKKHHGYSSVSVSTMRGCPYTCKWCSRAVYGGTYRRRPAKMVVEELLDIQRTYNPDKIWFVDDVFTISHKWLQEFHDEIKRISIKIEYEIITRADRMNESVITLLKNSGCYRIWIGAESGSQEIIDAMDRRVDAEKVRQMIISTRRAGMEAGTFIMVGYPGETRKHLAETIRHLTTSQPNFYTITTAYPIAGTPLYEEVKGSIEFSGQLTEITDRDYTFKRTYTAAYYNLAIRWIHNAVAIPQSRGLKKLKYYFKSIAAQILMYFA